MLTIAALVLPMLARTDIVFLSAIEVYGRRYCFFLLFVALIISVLSGLTGKLQQGSLQIIVGSKQVCRKKWEKFRIEYLWNYNEFLHASKTKSLYKSKTSCSYSLSVS